MGIPAGSLVSALFGRKPMGGRNGRQGEGGLNCPQEKAPALDGRKGKEKPHYF